MKVNADLHIHSKYSGGTSKNMSIALISREAKKKGVQLLATGDCLHSKWMAEIKEMESIDEGTFELNGTRFVLTVEVEDNKRVHHLLFFPSFSAAEGFREKIKNHSPNIDSDGRPNIALGGEKIAQLAKDVDALIGPSHAFTPWTAMYAYHDSLKSCYGDLESYISFVELGLSADSDYADRIAELKRLTFLTNSDAHSPYPIRIAREFNRFEMNDITYSELKKALLREGRRRPVLNVGLPPQEGKYNESACIKCFYHYTLREALMHKWKCTKCGGRVKKGVRDRVNEIATYDSPKHPPHRPEYLYLIPLAEIISKAVGQSSPHTKTVFKIWNELITTFGDEVKVLVDTNIEEIAEATEERVTNAIKVFREGRVVLHPGGGGQYGQVELPDDNLATPFEPEKKKRRGQTSLFEF
ncbi:MAG: TIGR00375 family protein [Thermoplasmata archaeon]